MQVTQYNVKVTVAEPLSSPPCDLPTLKREGRSNASILDRKTTISADAAPRCGEQRSYLAAAMYFPGSSETKIRKVAFVKNSAEKVNVKGRCSPPSLCGWIL